MDVVGIVIDMVHHPFFLTALLPITARCLVCSDLATMIGQKQHIATFPFFD
jgi:hypothetical protein